MLTSCKDKNVRYKNTPSAPICISFSLSHTCTCLIETGAGLASPSAGPLCECTARSRAAFLTQRGRFAASWCRTATPTPMFTFRYHQGVPALPSGSGIRMRGAFSVLFLVFAVSAPWIMSWMDCTRSDTPKGLVT